MENPELENPEEELPEETPELPKAVQRGNIKDIYSDEKERQQLEAAAKWAKKVFAHPEDFNKGDVALAWDITKRFDEMKHGGIARPVEEKSAPTIIINVKDVRGTFVPTAPHEHKVVDLANLPDDNDAPRHRQTANISPLVPKSDHAPKPQSRNAMKMFEAAADALEHNITNITERNDKIKKFRQGKKKDA